MRRLFLMLAVLWPAFAAAQTPEQSQAIELEKLRAKIAGEVQLTAYNLLDELVYHWTQSPPFGNPTAVFVADITVPVGLGTGLKGLLENHLTSVLTANPTTRITLSHCPSCTAVIMESGPKGTVVSRGLDNPEALAKIGGAGGRYGLYIDFAAEGAFLVLRARITELTPDLPIVWSHTLSSSVGTPSLLRDPHALKSAADARQEYLDALNDRSAFTIPIRFVLRSYEAGDSGIPPPPIIWLQTGFEMALTHARSWTTSLMLGFSWLPDAYDGVMIQSRFNRLLSGDARSMSSPNLYLFIGAALMTLDGPAIGPFSTNDATAIQRQAEGSLDSRASFGAFHLGLDYRVGNRVGASVFLENMPAYNDSENLGLFLQNGIIDFHSFGAEVTFCF